MIGEEEESMVFSFISRQGILNKLKFLLFFKIYLLFIYFYFFIPFVKKNYLFQISSFNSNLLYIIFFPIISLFFQFFFSLDSFIKFLLIFNPNFIYFLKIYFSFLFHHQIKNCICPLIYFLFWFLSSLF